MTRSEKFKTAVDYYRTIERLDNELTEECKKEIAPLLNSGKYDEAYKYVREFFKESNLDGVNVFLGHDLLLAKINRLKKINH